jgi:rare lipoprotein A
MLALAVLAACSTTPDRSGLAPGTELGRGRASWYGPGFHGKRTASGERFDMDALTAAHRTLPFGTRVRVRNPQNGREVVVRINDRGPQKRDRIIDLSKAAAAAIGLVQVGDASVVLIVP